MVRKGAALLLLALCAGLIALAKCSELPSLEKRFPSSALLDAETTKLGKAVSPLVEAHPGISGVFPLRDARDAFAARCLLAQGAERSLDVQYYIWRKDMSGTMLFKALHDAAERGVRVRLLLDDNNTSGLDTVLAALDAHPNVEVRLFNPFVIRKPRFLSYVTDFSRLNRRMHNKSFTADNQATIVGGRNVGDEYFGATEGVLFADLDVIAAGPVVREVSRDFDRYWASESSYPADRLLLPVDAAQIAELKTSAAQVERNPEAVSYMTALKNSPFVRELVEGTLPLKWAPARVISDDPSKGLDRAPREELLTQKMKNIFGEPATAVDLVSPYFVPTATGVDLFVGWEKRGVKVRILTNSLEATDVAAVHAGYAKRRKALLRGGVTLYELRLSAGATANVSSLGGSSGSSLHAKTFSVDGSRVFVGSFNFDPRSAELNTEMGVVVESPEIGRQMTAAFESSIPMNAYEVRLTDDGKLYWMERQQEKLIRHDTEPGTSFWQRAVVAFLSILPIEWLL